MPEPTLITVVETPSFVSRAKTRLSDEERATVISMVAAEPECGDVIPGGSGIRKVRLGIGGRGKSGGARVIYYYHCPDVPVFLLTVFAKSEQANLTAAERNQLGAVAKTIAKAYGRG